ncbi:MAG: aspartate/glutamate racemase family protein [Draconibacterium sp.]
MKTIGLIAGMSWESSAVYYNIFNRKTAEILGGYHSAKCIMVSVDFAEIEELQHKNNWKLLEKMMIQLAQQLEKAGADFVVLGTNTMHFCAFEIEKSIHVPFLHIADATGQKIKKTGLQKVALLGTRFTMEMDFYTKFIYEKFGIEVMVPDKPERELIHRIIYNELVHGIILNESREKVKQIVNNMNSTGAEGVILGCTEIPLLISDSDVDIPVFDTTKIHAERAVEIAIMGE